MRATITAAVIHNGQAIIGQVGDSRSYLIRDDQIQWLTGGQLTKEMAVHSPLRSIIPHALGAKDTIEPALSFVRVERDDYLLLCSDGLSNKIANVEMYDVVRETSTPSAACERLVALANERGGEDNITLILARFDGAGWPEPSPDREIKVGYL